MAVLAAAEALLSECGYSSITIEQIAARAGASKATIYRWWPSKAAIFMEIYSLLGNEFAQPGNTGTVENDLRTQLRAAFKLFRETVAAMALAGFVAEAQSNPETARLLREEFALFRRQANVDVLNRAIARGEVRADITPELVSEMISGAVYYSVLVGQPDFTDARADEIVRTILHGVLVDMKDTGTARDRAPRAQAAAKPGLRLQAAVRLSAPAACARPRPDAASKKTAR